MRHRHLAASLTTAALLLAAAAQAAPPMASGPSVAAPEQALLVGNGGNGNNKNGGNGDGGLGGDLNRTRESEGRDRVRHDNRLERAAQDYAQRLANSNHFDHTGPDGSSPQDRAQDANCNCVAVAENLAKGYRNADQVFDAWMRSNGHRQNMMRRNYTSYGLGRSGDTWVLMLSD